MKLYELTSLFSELFSQFDYINEYEPDTNADGQPIDGDGNIIENVDAYKDKMLSAWFDTLEGIEGEFDEKAENIAVYVKSMLAMAKTLKAEEDNLKARRKRCEKSAERMKAYKRIYEYFSDVPRVGVTATPVRLNGDGLCDVNDKLIIGVSTKWLIENNCLAPYDYYAPSVADLTGLHTKMGEYVTADIEKAMIKNTVFGDVIKYYRQLADGKKAVCYCSSVKHSTATAKAFCDAGIKAVHIDGNTPKAERNRIINDFRKGEITILCNVDLISEGFDVPDCECTILLRPTHSLTLYIQQSMRCMRYRPGKRAIIIDHVGNYARHGMPDDDREWSLEKKKKQSVKKLEEQQGEKVRQCPECFFTFAAPPPGTKAVCPHCGYVFPTAERAVEIDTTAELIKVEGFKLDLKTPDDCHSYADLLDYAEKHGYKTGWAYYQAKRRGMIA